MINILNGICRALAESFPKAPIYIDNLPHGFNRDSFYVELINSGNTDLTAAYQKRNLAFQITYFGIQDEFDKVSTVELYATLEVLNKIFYRALKTDNGNFRRIQSTDSFIKDGLLFMTLRLEYSHEQEENPFTPTEARELMKELNIKYNK